MELEESDRESVWVDGGDAIIINIIMTVINCHTIHIYSGVCDQMTTALRSVAVCVTR